jgi:CspA family cold shock protein
MKGSITKVVADRGFAFIRGDDGVDYFAHVSEVLAAFDQLVVGLVVRFDTIEGPKGPRAERVEVIG